MKNVPSRVAFGQSFCVAACLFLAAGGCASVPSSNSRLLDDIRRALDARDVEWLAGLIGSGYKINEPLFEFSSTLLHQAALYEDTNAVVLLLNRGAIRDVRDEFGQRPIDGAYMMGNLDVCKILAVSNGNDRAIGGWPQSVLEEIFLWECCAVPTNEMLLETFASGDPKCITYISVNDKPVQSEMLGWFKQFWPNARSLMQWSDGQIDREFLGMLAEGRTNAVRKLEVRIEEKNPDEFRWMKRYYEWSRRGFGGGRLVYRYGMWLRLNFSEDDTWEAKGSDAKGQPESAD